MILNTQRPVHLNEDKRVGSSSFMFDLLFNQDLIFLKFNLFLVSLWKMLSLNFIQRFVVLGITMYQVLVTHLPVQMSVKA